MATQITLHAFTLTLLGDLDARAEFQADPEGCLEAAGLGDISVAEVHEILPLVLDSASVVNVDALDKVLVEAGDLTAADSLKLVTGHVEGVTGVADAGAAPSAITALVTDFGGVGDVSHSLDATVLTAGDVVSDVSGHSAAAVTEVAGVADVHGVTDVLVKDIATDVVVKEVSDSDVVVKHAIDSVDVDVKDVADLSHNVVHDVAQVGDVHHEVGQVVGDINVGDIHVLDGGVGNNNDVDIHF
ncbi:IniB N-terminal domain-containing protein [Lentzea aerocolonigenes]|uniref:IniB N-terminal domain-containing protein n=1 Tax=Lentzea aerocolonigenes TaxID=68170 RepID=UPI0004C34A30|nr:IniB N-terminal domain-containing protein [Lentzea aerocolonigenes]MCP2246767.1 hypothetical protein [Lentzea aerocolonigenes]